MKTLFPSILGVLVAGSAFAGETIVQTQYADAKCSRTLRTRSAGTEGAWYHSSLFHSKVVLINDTDEYVTFFVYSGSVCGPNEINRLIRNGAQVYETVVPPHHVSYTDERGPHYWVGSKPGKWGIDMAKNRVVPLR